MLDETNTLAKSPKRLGRKRAFNVAGLLVASAVAMSITSAAAFQSSSMNGRAHHKESLLTQHHVVTDPSQLMQMEFPDSDDYDRRALEDIYLLTSAVEGLSGKLVEDAPTQRIARKKVGKQKSKSYTNGESLPHRPPQFRGLTTSHDRKPRKRNSLVRSSPTVKSRALLSEQRRNSNMSRSSTMPGFIERSNSGRVKAFNDGIKIAEQRSGRKFVDTAAAKKKRRQVNGETMYKTSAAVPDSMVHFANEIHEVERITPKEEIFLGEKTQEAVRLQKIYDGLIMQLEREPTDAEWCAASGKINMEAISQAIEDGLEAKNKLVTSNLRMVQGVVNVYIRNGLRGQYNAGDLMQEGIMVCLELLPRFALSGYSSSDNIVYSFVTGFDTCSREV
jgi:hypothetical protein